MPDPADSRLGELELLEQLERLDSEHEEWARRARALVRGAGHRRGGARELLIEVFAREHCALSAQAICGRLRGWLDQGIVTRPVGVASVYRGIDLLAELGLIVRVEVGDGIARYERAELEHSEHQHHHHFVCDACGLLVPFDDAGLEQAIAALQQRLGFGVSGHDVVLRGRCLRCG